VAVETIFVSYSFRQTTRDVLDIVEKILESQDLRWVTGEILEGRQLTAELQTRIKRADGLIAILTPEAQRPDGTFQPTLWVYHELQTARQLQKPNIALQYPTVVGTPGDYEHIPFDPANPYAGVLRLNSTIAAWKRTAGQRVKVRILPRDIEPIINGGGAQGEFRFSSRDGTETRDWCSVDTLRVEPGGAFAHLNGVPPDAYVQVRIRAGGRCWQSVSTPQIAHVEMAEVMP
jgi:hypothetical protein